MASVSTKTKEEISKLIESESELNRFISKEGGFEKVVSRFLLKDEGFQKEFEKYLKNRYAIHGKN